MKEIFNHFRWNWPFSSIKITCFCKCFLFSVRNPGFYHWIILTSIVPVIVITDDSLTEAATGHDFERSVHFKRIILDWNWLDQCWLSGSKLALVEPRQIWLNRFLASFFCCFLITNYFSIPNANQQMQFCKFNMNQNCNNNTRSEGMVIIVLLIDQSLPPKFHSLPCMYVLSFCIFEKFDATFMYFQRISIRSNLIFLIKCVYNSRIRPVSKRF